VQENENNNKNKKYASCTGIKIQTVERVSCFFLFLQKLAILSDMKIATIPGVHTVA